MRVARVLALCARHGTSGIQLSGYQQLGVVGVHALRTLSCISAAVAAPCSKGEPSQLQLLQRSLLVQGQHRQHASMAAAAVVAESSGSESETESEVRPEALTAVQYRRKYQMWVDAKDAPEPCQTFDQAGLPAALLNALLRHGFTAPTFIQAQAWPIARQGRDLVAIASTGSGKTAGFLVPAFLHIQEQLRLQQQHQQQLQQQQPQEQQQQQQDRRQRRQNGWNKWDNPASWGGSNVQPPLALVLAPTRELAQQIQHEAERLGAAFKIKNTCLYGGAPRGPQARALAAGPHLLIATPGRLLDFITSGGVNVSKVSMLVLDEADRMLDMGFEPQIREVLSHMPGGDLVQAVQADDLAPPPRQTLFFSATWPKEVQAIARQLCRNDPVRVFVGNVQDKLVANRDVTQLVAMLGHPKDRLPALQDYLHEHLHGAELISSSSSSSRGSSSRGRQDPYAEEDSPNPQPRVVVFAAKKRDCDWLTLELGRSGMRAVAVHGDKSQRERDHAIAAFRRGQVPVLVATDVAARGLDIPGVTAVVNYEFPTDHEMYVHRIGRTGRAGRKGESLTFLTPEDASVTPVLVDIMRGAGQEVPAELEAVAARVRKPAQNKHRYGSSSGRGGSSRGSGWGGSSSSSSRGGSDRWGGGSRGGAGYRRERDDWSSSPHGGSSRGRGNSSSSSGGGGGDYWGQLEDGFESQHRQGRRGARQASAAW